ADNAAHRYHISRAEQDDFALNSHQTAGNSHRKGHIKDEIAPLLGQIQDEGPRSRLNKKLVERLPPAFTHQGTVTAGNACAINDCASAVLIMSEEKCLSLGLIPKLIFKDATSVGVDPNLLGIGPIPAVKKLLKRTRL